MDDAELLWEYAEAKSEGAFRTLVERYVPLVYSAALRQVSDSALAEDITQVVFILLARKAGSLPDGVVLPGWLYRTTHHTAAKALRTEHRRRQREQEAMRMQTAETNTGWEQMAPFLDQAMAELSEWDRGMVLLRFFQNKSLRDVGRAYGVSEDTAQKRVARAINKLRRILLRRGVALPLVAITGLLSTHAAQLAPTHLGTSVMAAALSKAAMSTPVYALLHEALRQSIWPRIAAAVPAGLGLAAVVAAMVYLWPKPAQGSSSYSFYNRIVTHTRPAPPLTVAKPTPPAPAATTNLVAASTSPTPPDPLPVRMPVAVRPTPPPVVALRTNRPAPVVATTASDPPPPADMSAMSAPPGPFAGSLAGQSSYGLWNNQLVVPGAVGQTTASTNQVVWWPAQRAAVIMQRVSLPVRNAPVRSVSSPKK